MGLFVGVPGPAGRTGSSADVAAALGWPVLLVLDASGQSQSAAAVAKGCATLRSAHPDRRTSCSTSLGSPRHAPAWRGGNFGAGAFPIVGAMPRSDAVALPERHLGLVQAGETSDLEMRLEQMADFVAANTDIQAIRALAVRRSGACRTSSSRRDWRRSRRRAQKRIAVARDATFSSTPLSACASRLARAQGAEMTVLLPAGRRGAG